MNEKRGILELSVLAVKVVMCVLLIVNAVIFIYYGVINRSDVLRDDEVRYIEDWNILGNEGEEYTVSTTLPQGIKDNDYIFFYIRRNTYVYINGELRKDFIEKRDVNIPGGSIKKFYIMVPLQASDAGAEIKVVRSLSINGEPIEPEAFVGTRYAGFVTLMRSSGPSFILATIVLIFSIVVIIVSIVLRSVYKLKIDMMYGALGTTIIALWVITDSFLFPFIFGVYHVNGILNYNICLMIPFAPGIYLNAVQRGRYRKCMSVIMILSAINAVLWPVLHFTGIFPFYNVRNMVNTIFAIIAGIAIYVLIHDAVKGNIRGYKYTFIGFLGFLVCCLSELVILFVKTTTNEAVPMVVGLAVLLVFIVIQQVDDLRKVNMEKQRAIDMSEAKTRFLASMSHEIRTPINSILGMNEMILRENNDRVIDGYSRNIKTSGKMLLMLVNDVLDFSKIEAGKLEITNARFYMSDMLYDVISLVGERADSKSLELKTELEGEIPNEMISDEFRIRQILVNLINNAVKYTDKGTVTLRIGGSYTGEDGYELAINVKDTGRGISEEEQPHLFEAFSRADVKSNVNIEGTGLGLAIVKSIVDSMKGTLGVESEYGKGSEFWVKLPVKYKGNELLKDDFMTNRVEPEKTPEVSDFSAPDAKVLAVDDNNSNLTIVKLFLKRTGIKPDLCSSGSRAIELCKEKKYDLILLDHMMPQPDGIETLHVIKSDEASLNKDTKVIVLTANAVAGSRKMYMDEGFDDYLTKPLDSGLLENAVRKMLPQDKVVMGSGTVTSMCLKGSGTVTSMCLNEEVSPIKKKLTSIEGLDYETAFCYCGNDEGLLEEIIADVAAECADRTARMRKALDAKDMKAYAIEAHTIKSTMATIGLKSLSERAKRHELSAKENNTGFVYGDAEDFISDYEDVCKKLEG